MEEKKTYEGHSEDICDIISTPPSWLVRWGITIVLAIMLLLLFISAIIKYPDIVKTQVRINAANSPKAIVGKMSGGIVKLLAKNGDHVERGQSIAWMESTANHEHVLGLLQQLNELNGKFSGKNIKSIAHIDAPYHLRLGELQNRYQIFYQAYLSFKSSVDGGVLLKKAAYLKAEVENIRKHAQQLIKQKELQQMDFELAQKEIKMYDTLFAKKVISQAEYQKQKSEFLNKHYPIQQTEASLLANKTSLLVKQNALVDLNSKIENEKFIFMQSLNSLISEIKNWQSKYILTAMEEGTLVYAGFVQEHQYIEAGQDVFYVNPGSTNFYGEAAIPQYSMGKVQIGQRVLIKLNSYPFEEYGMIEGQIEHLSGVPLNDSIFLSKMSLNTNNLKNNITLKSGMLGTAEIITDNVSLLHRLNRNVTKVFDNIN